MGRVLYVQILLQKINLSCIQEFIIFFFFLIMLSFCCAGMNYMCQNLIIQPFGRQFRCVLYDGLLVFRTVFFASVCSVGLLK